MKKIIYFILFFCTVLFLFNSCTYPYHYPEEEAAFDIESPYLTVINGLSENLSFIKKEGESLTESTVQTGQSPNQIIKHKNNVYIVNSLANSILIYDYKTFEIKNEFSTGTGTNPFKAAIYNDQIYVTAYLTHQLLVYNLSGSHIATHDLEILNESSKIYYPFPQGITLWDSLANDYIFIACMYSEENGATKTRNPGRVAVFSLASSSIIGYIDAGAKDTNQVLISNDILYIISSGSYSSGFLEDGKIETVDLNSVNMSNPSAIVPVTQAGESSFGAFCIYNDQAWTGNLGNGTLRYYDASQSPWIENKNRTFPGGHGMAYIPDIQFAAKSNQLFVTEFNGNKLYILDPETLDIHDQYSSSANRYGDAQFMLLIE
ncbi:MAG: hypothetical protein MJB14_12665 [Spirochaetes bacterium]|nr:hypothetical protein [Spirochaetota bacterium]